jgi:hypothetical protein
VKKKEEREKQIKKERKKESKKGRDRERVRHTSNLS